MIRQEVQNHTSILVFLYIKVIHFFVTLPGKRPLKNSIVSLVDEVSNAGTESRDGRVGQVSHTAPEVAHVVDACLVGQGGGGGQGDGLEGQGGVQVVKEAEGNGVLETGAEVL